MGESVIRVRPLARDKYGDTPDGTPARKTLPNCAVATGGSVESLTSGRDSVVSDYVVFAPDGSDVLPTDQLLIRGRLCDVVGRPFAWVSPFTNRRPGVEIHANLTEG